jgi:Ca2+:H+ antiporter
MKSAFKLSLFLFIPVSIWLHLIHFNPIVVFISAILAVIPLTNLIAKSTQQISIRTATVIGSLINATFGNAIEFMIAIFALKAGLVTLVKASISGSIILNILSLIGLSILFGGLKYKEQKFNKDSAGVASTMLLIAVAGLSLPTIYSVLTGNSATDMSLAVSVILGITYVLSLVFVLFTHRHLFVAERTTSEHIEWSITEAVLTLVVSIGIAAIEANILVDSLQPLITASHLKETFVGLVIVAIITNIPEHLVAITYGRRDNITLSLEIGMNSAIQIALFVVPVLVLISPLLGVEMNLVFSPFEMAAMILTVMIINYIGSDGVCNWLEGVQLVAVYIIIAIAFYFI